ncbi:MAG: hypothetical protein ACYC7E_07260 [Armatimonadota bacterium]
MDAPSPWASFFIAISSAVLTVAHFIWQYRKSQPMLHIDINTSELKRASNTRKNLLIVTVSNVGIVPVTLGKYGIITEPKGIMHVLSEEFTPEKLPIKLEPGEPHIDYLNLKRADLLSLHGIVAITPDGKQFICKDPVLLAKVRDDAFRLIPPPLFPE